jgi:hypothetical protein
MPHRAGPSLAQPHNAKPRPALPGPTRPLSALQVFRKKIQPSHRQTNPSRAERCHAMQRVALLLLALPGRTMPSHALPDPAAPPRTAKNFKKIQPLPCRAQHCNTMHRHAYPRSAPPIRTRPSHDKMFKIKRYSPRLTIPSLPSPDPAPLCRSQLLHAERFPDPKIS